MTEISDYHRGVASVAAAAFRVDRPPVDRFWDADERSDIFILRAADTPQPGVTSYSTIGLSAHPLMLDGAEFGTRVEIVGACGSTYPRLDNVLATLAFCVINSKWFCAPGKIFPGVVATLGASSTLHDIYFASPFLWKDGLKSTQLGGKTISWLLAVPIARSETDYAARKGPEALETLLEQKGIDIFDLNRPPVV